MKYSFDDFKEEFSEDGFFGRVVRTIKNLVMSSPEGDLCFSPTTYVCTEETLALAQWVTSYFSLNPIEVYKQYGKPDTSFARMLGIKGQPIYEF